jgi:gamma-glutamyl phosphate reductase
MVGVEITIIRAKNNNNNYKTIYKLITMPDYCLLAVRESVTKTNKMRYKKDFEKLDIKLDSIIKDLEKTHEEIEDYNSGRSEAFIEKKGDNLDALLNQIDKALDNLYEVSNKLSFVVGDF